MAKKNTPVEESNKKLQELVSDAEYFFERYRNLIFGSLIGLVVIIGGYVGYKALIAGPKEQKAQDAIFAAQELFNADSFQLALKGTGGKLGFEAIAKTYGSTAAGNTAHFYAGVCNLKMGKYQDAINAFNDFKGNDKLIEARKYGCTGDAYSELGQMDKAIENYKKAGDVVDNELTTPVYWYRAALALELKGSKKEALDLYKKVNNLYPNTQEGMASETSIGKLEQQVN
jgi:tetratricopeptide (TPR) repeat protein